MSIFDRLKKLVQTTDQSLDQKVTFTFRELPKSLAELQTLNEASLDTPFKTAALTVLALCCYAVDKENGKEMLNWLRGPRPLSREEISELNDIFRDGKTYIPFSYFVGATPENDYTPKKPYTIIIETGKYSFLREGYTELRIPCGGANYLSSIILRKRGSDGKWFLWEEHLARYVKIPISLDPWA